MEKAGEECFVDYITVSLISVVDGESEIGRDTPVNLPRERCFACI